MVFSALKRAPLAVAYLVLSSFIATLHPMAEKLLRLADSLVMIAAAMCIVYEVWSALSGTPRQEHKLDYRRITSAFGASWAYGLAVLVGSLLFIAPGVYFMFSASLAIVFICIDGDTAISSLGASRKLVRGNFWRAMGYLSPAALLTVLGVAGVFLVGGVGAGLAFGEAESPAATAVDVVLGTGLSLALTWLALSIVPLQVRLFHALKIEKGEIPNPNAHTAR